VTSLIRKPTHAPADLVLHAHGAPCFVTVLSPPGKKSTDHSIEYWPEPRRHCCSLHFTDIN